MNGFLLSTLWNLWLAVVPVGLGLAMYFVERRGRGRDGMLVYVGLGLLFLLWLAFVPNTCYLVTEWRHFLDQVDSTDLYQRAQRDRALLFQISTLALFYLFYSGFGLLSLTLSIRPIERMLRARGLPFYRVAPALFTLLSTGVYLGLVLRLNSWDLWNRPGLVWRSIAAIPSNPMLVVAILVFGLLLWALYEGLDIWVDGIAERLEMARR